MLLLYLERVQVVQGQYCYCTHVLRPDSLDLSVISLSPQTLGCRWGAGGKVLFLSLPLRLGTTQWVVTNQFLFELSAVVCSLSDGLKIILEGACF